MQSFKIDRTIYKGSPKAEGRLDKEMRVYDLLEKLNIDYERIDHDPTMSVDSCGEVEKILDITPGSVSVLGLMNDIHNNVQLIVDKDVLAGDYIGCHPCINTSSLKISTRDIFEKFIPYVKNEVIYVEI